MNGLFLSLGVVFIAELGDKSQLMALAFATRYRPGVVLAGISISTAVVHLLSVALGHLVGSHIPHKPLGLLAAAAFVGFGLWTLKGDVLTSEDEERAARDGRWALLTVGVVFFLAELGDKTMLTTVTLAASHGWLGVWIGSTVGMVAADALAIVVGRQLGTRLPEKAIRIGAAVAFFAFAAWLTVDALAT